MNMNDIPSREEIADMITLHSCTRNCMGNVGNSAGCCSLGDRDYIIGPIPDAKDFLERYRKNIDPYATHEQVFVDYKEGKELFPDRDCWQAPENFPALRVNMNEKKHGCKFLGEDNLCTVHAIRSTTCRNYMCGYVGEILEKLSVNPS